MSDKRSEQPCTVRDVANLAQRLCHALRIARKAVRTLGQTGYHDPGKPDHNVSAEKIVSETAMLALSAAAAASAPELRDVKELAGLVREVVDLLIPLARSEKAYVGMCFEPALAMDLSLTDRCLTSLGYGDDVFAAMLEQAAAAEYSWARERLPHRALEQDWIRRIGLRQSAVSARERRILGSSILAGPIDYLTCTRDDLYAMTHALMYATDLGQRPIRLPRRRRDVIADIEFALARCIDDEDYDLAGELAMAWPLLHTQFTQTGAFSFAVLRWVEDVTGYLPGASTRMEEYNKLEGEERGRYFLASAYHTAYVMGMLCAAVLRAPEMRQRRAVPRRRALNAALWEIVRRDGQRRHWMEQPEDEAPAEFLFGVAAWRATKRKDLAALYQLCVLAQEDALANGPGMRCATALLRRAAALSRSLSECRAGAARIA